MPEIKLFDKINIALCCALDVYKSEEFYSWVCDWTTGKIKNIKGIRKHLFDAMTQRGQVWSGHGQAIQGALDVIQACIYFYSDKDFEWAKSKVKYKIACSIYHSSCASVELKKQINLVENIEAVLNDSAFQNTKKTS